MFICPNCQKKFKDGTVFCDACGTKLEEVAQICPACGAKNSLKATSCQACGTSFVPESNAPSADKPRKKLPIKWIVAAAGAVVVVVVLAIVLINVLGGDSGSTKYNYSLYLKDDEIMFSNLSDDPQQVTSRLISSSLSSWIDADQMEALGSALEGYCFVSDDGNIIFYPDKMDIGSDGYTIYYRELNDPNADPVKVATDVREYTVSDDAAIVTYLKGSDDCLLYRYDRKSDSTEKIGSDVDDFKVSKDGKTVYYWSWDDEKKDKGSLYVNRVGEEREKIDSDMSEFVYMTEDAETVYYLKDDSLYKKTESEDKEKIASDVASVLKVYESGEIYFLKSDTEEKSLKDYLYDDMKSQDASMEEPSSWEYEDYEDYEKAYEAYRAKLKRDRAREMLDYYGDDITWEDQVSRLFYYDGSKAKVVTEGYESLTTYASDEPVIIFQASGSGSANKVNLSELDFENISSYFDMSDLVSLLKSDMQSNATRYIAVEGEATALESKDASYFRITSDGESIYYLDNIPEGKEYGELFEITISKGTVGEPKVYDSDVYRYSIRLLADDQLAYYKDVDSDGDNGELYVNKKRVDSDVAVGQVGYVKESDTLVYFVDWNDNKEMGTLKVYADGKATKVRDDVHDVGLSTTGDILYLYDYSNSSHKGDLYVYGSSEKIDMDVSAIIPVYNAD